MTIRAAFAAIRQRLTVSDLPDLSQPYRMANASTYGHALPIDQMPNADGLALLQARRLALLTEARRLKCLRRSKAGSICEAELRRVTHQILAHRRKAESAGVSA
jgi:hypothetical protein